ncbi:helix-turn-helix domain-containing protein [Phenylobacterium sp. LjRoot219]|uniref:IclR family transcriptional regulator domain-containing protein n=1 Tax=Phenylobacterium sp. LjRoot219 TaxID=3342283 RepID=UPI003ECD04BB
MPRPALSASRGVDILDFLAGFPGRSFTLSEIARAAKINVASCHAVLSALTERGYLSRTSQRTYALGPALVAVGHAALKSQPLVARAREAAEELAAEFGVGVLLSAVVGDEILGVVAIDTPDGRDPGLRVGERMPLAPPVGAPFLAWSSAEAIDAWIARRAGAADAQLVAEWREALATIRRRGFQVTLRAPDSSELASLMAEMASGRQAPQYKDQMIRLVGSLDHHLSQPAELQPDALYDIVLIAAPIFDQNGEAAFNLCLGGFPEPVSGARIQAYADRLVRTCVQIMRENRTQAA